MTWNLEFTKLSLKDGRKLKEAGLWEKTRKLLNIIEENPFQAPPSYEKLLGDLKGAYSRRINIQHRLIYSVFEDKKVVRILRMWTHYE